MIMESQYMAYLGDENPFSRSMDELNTEPPVTNY